MSDAGLGLREEPLYKGTLGAWDLGAAHPSWFDENPDPTCPQCGAGPESFQHAILTCPARKRVRDLQLKEVSSLEDDARI